MSTFRRKEIVFLIALFLFALSLRFVYLSQLQKTPWFDAPIEDAGRYDQWAKAIQEGSVFHEGPYQFIPSTRPPPLLLWRR